MQLIPDEFDWSDYEVAPEVSKLHPARDYCQGVIDALYGDTSRRFAVLPWEKAGGRWQIRPGEVTVYAGINGHGKTIFTSQIMLSLMAQGERVLAISLEMAPIATMVRMCRQAAGNGEPPVRFVRNFHRWTDDRLWLFDHHGNIRAAKVLAIARYAIEKFGVQHVLIDSLMKCGLGVDDYNAQKQFLNDLCDLGMTTGAHVHLVAHARKGGSERDSIDKFSIRGAGEIADQADNIVLIWRNKIKEAAAERANPDQDGADAFVDIAKQRHGGWEGRLAFWFDRGAQSFVEAPGSRPRGLRIDDVEEPDLGVAHADV